MYVDNVAEVIQQAFPNSPLVDRLDGLNAILLPREEAKR